MISIFTAANTACLFFPADKSYLVKGLSSCLDFRILREKPLSTTQPLAIQLGRSLFPTSLRSLRGHIDTHIHMTKHLDDAVLLEANSKNIHSTCSIDDQFRAIDIGPIVSYAQVGMTLGAAIADNTSYLMQTGDVRLYFWAGQQNAKGTGVHSLRTVDGTDAIFEDGLRLPTPYGHPKVFLARDGRLHMYHLVIDGLGSHASYDGIVFSLQDGMRLSSADAALERIGGMSVLEIDSNTFRGYFSNLGIPGVPPNQVVDQIRSAVSNDLFNWASEGKILIGEGATELRGKARQPFALRRSATCVTLLYQKVDRSPTKIYYSTAPDGLSFSKEYRLNIEGWGQTEAGPNVQVLANGQYRLFYDAQNDELGNHIRVADFEMY